MKLIFPNGERAPIVLEEGVARVGSSAESTIVVAAPGASLLMSSVMMTLPSGVICGFTLSDRLALRNDTLVAPEDVAC